MKGKQTEMSIEEIDAEFKRLQKLRKTVLRKERVDGIKSVTEIVKKYDLSEKDLERAFLNSKKKNKGLVSDTKKVVPPKYRSKKGETWTGRGRPPAWILEHEATGSSREGLLIQE